jgi:hypothetical protein
MVEALIAVTITTIGGAALLTSVGAAVQTSTDAVHRAVARGLAEQMIDEIAAQRFPAATNPTPAGTSRSSFDDIDDYDGWSARPPQDRQGLSMGTEGGTVSGAAVPRLDAMRPDLDLIGRFTRRVEVERIQPDSSSGWTVVSQHTNFRRVTVRVDYTDAQANTATLAEISRILTYVPFAP